MSSVLEKIQAIEKIGASDQIDQTLQKWIHIHLQKYERQIEGIQKDLLPFEKQFGMSSEKGHVQYEAGLLGDDSDAMDWMGLYDNLLLFQERAKMLRSVIDV